MEHKTQIWYVGVAYDGDLDYDIQIQINCQNR